MSRITSDLRSSGHPSGHDPRDTSGHAVRIRFERAGICRGKAAQELMPRFREWRVQMRGLPSFSCPSAELCADERGSHGVGIDVDDLWKRNRDLALPLD